MDNYKKEHRKLARILHKTKSKRIKKKIMKKMFWLAYYDCKAEPIERIIKRKR